MAEGVVPDPDPETEPDAARGEVPQVAEMALEAEDAQGDGSEEEAAREAGSEPEAEQEAASEGPYRFSAPPKPVT